MAKKSFIDKGNPALQFISAPREESPEKKVPEEESSGKTAGRKVRETKKEKAPAGKPQGAQSAKSGRSAGEDSAEFAAVQERHETVVQPVYQKHPVAPRRQGESKSKRVQLLVPPSLHMRVSRKAAAMDMSFNEYVNQVLEKSCGQ